MSEPTPPAFDPAEVAESNATSYPEKFRADNSRRWNRRLGDHVRRHVEIGLVKVHQLMIRTDEVGPITIVERRS